MGQGADPNIGLSIHHPITRSLSLDPDLVYQLDTGSPASHNPAPGIPLADRADLLSAAQGGMTEWLDYLDTEHPDVHTWVMARSSAERDHLHKATLYL